MKFDRPLNKETKQIIYFLVFIYFSLSLICRYVVWINIHSIFLFSTGSRHSNIQSFFFCFYHLYILELSLFWIFHSQRKHFCLFAFCWHFERHLSHNGYCYKKWAWWSEFKSWPRLFVSIPPGKGMNPSILLSVMSKQLGWLNSLTLVWKLV